MTKLIGKFGVVPWSEIQELLVLGKIEEALKLLPQSEDVMFLLVPFNDAKRQYITGMIDYSEWARIQNQMSLLLVRFVGGKRQYSMGMIDYSEWARIQNQIAYSALEFKPKPLT